MQYEIPVFRSKLGRRPRNVPVQWTIIPIHANSWQIEHSLKSFAHKRLNGAFDTKYMAKLCNYLRFQQTREDNSSNHDFASVIHSKI